MIGASKERKESNDQKLGQFGGQNEGRRGLVALWTPKRENNMGKKKVV